MSRSPRRKRHSPRKVAMKKGIEYDEFVRLDDVQNDLKHPPLNNMLDNNLILHRINQMRHLATDGPLSYRALAFAGGLGMIVTSLSDWFGEIYTSSYMKALISFYTLLFGILFSLLEIHLWATNEIMSKARAFIYDQVRALRYLLGRGLLYVFAGTLQASQMNAIDIGSGGFMIFIGLLAIIVGKSTARRLNRLQNAIFDGSVIKRLFNQYDQDQDGHLTRKQFASFIRGIGLELGQNEFKNAFDEIDWDGDNKISYNEFRKWWDKFLVEDIADYLVV